MRVVSWLSFFLATATTAAAADLTVTVQTPAGKPVRDAVVTLHPDASSGPLRLASLRMVQQDLQFDPFVMVAPVGSEVSFPNRDPVRHHVYSFSPANRFELRLYGKDETRTVKFPVAGVVALGCNIHDQMVAFVKVVDTPFAAKTGLKGDAVLRGAPAGGGVMRVWHPYAKAPKNEIERRITLPREGGLTEALIVDLRVPPERRKGY